MTLELNHSVHGKGGQDKDGRKCGRCGQKTILRSF